MIALFIAALLSSSAFAGGPNITPPPSGRRGGEHVVTCVGNLRTVPASEGVLSLEDNGCGRNARSFVIPNPSGDKCFAPEISGVPVPKVMRREMVPGEGLRDVAYGVWAARGKFVYCIKPGATVYGISPTPDFTVGGAFYDGLTPNIEQAGYYPIGTNAMGEMQYVRVLNDTEASANGGFDTVTATVTSRTKTKQYNFSPVMIRAYGIGSPVKISIRE